AWPTCRPWCPYTDRTCRHLAARDARHAGRRTPRRGRRGRRELRRVGRSRAAAGLKAARNFLGRRLPQEVKSWELVRAGHSSGWSSPLAGTTKCADWDSTLDKPLLLAGQYAVGDVRRTSLARHLIMDRVSADKARPMNLHKCLETAVFRLGRFGTFSGKLEWWTNRGQTGHWLLVVQVPKNARKFRSA